MPDSTVAVIINWRRPANIPLILEALRGQTVPVTVALCECAPGTMWETPKEVQAGFDIVFSISRNIGPTSRFVPALAMPHHTYTFFQVDDFLPGPRCVEHMHRTAQLLHGNFATIGEDGNYINGNVLGREHVERQPTPVSADIIISSELVRTADIVHAVTLHARLAEEFPEALPCFEDDLLLCMGIQMQRQVASFLTPQCEQDHSYRLKDLPAPHGLWMRADHYERRNILVSQIRTLGWRSFANEASLSIPAPVVVHDS